MLNTTDKTTNGKGLHLQGIHSIEVSNTWKTNVLQYDKYPSNRRKRIGFFTQTR